VSTSTNAMLVYGYQLVGGVGEWLVEQADEDGCVSLPWLPDDDEEDYDLAELAMDQLMADAGFTETDFTAAGYYDRKKLAEERVGVKLAAHCSGEFPMWVLAAKVRTARRGNPQSLDLAELARQPALHGWDDKLRHACEVLTITPVQKSPCWLLCSWWA
jgi:hypothetical protein